MKFQLKTFWLLDDQTKYSGADLLSDCFALRAIVPRGGICVLESPSVSLVAAAFVVLDGWAAEVHLAPPKVAPDTKDEYVVIKNQSPKVNGGAKTTETSVQDSLLKTDWVLYTSGTTGTPKPVRHSLASLTKSHVASRRNQTYTWGLLYEPTRMAGIQVITGSLVADSSIIAPEISLTLSEKISRMREGHVSALSATPTLWRQILQSGLTSGWALGQVTLGGEIADQKILSSLETSFPSARVSHVYASTETGVAFSVHDAVEGFPLSYLEHPQGSVRLRIVDGLLEVANASQAGELSFISTGDSVEVRDERIRFLGRASGIVNVGGSKVWPEDVENLLREHPMVKEAFVWARSNSFSGSILMANVSTHADVGLDFPKELRKWIRGKGPSYFVPASVFVLDSIEVSSAGKVIRK